MSLTVHSKSYESETATTNGHPLYCLIKFFLGVSFVLSSSRCHCRMLRVGLRDSRTKSIVVECGSNRSGYRISLPEVDEMRQTSKSGGLLRADPTGAVVL